MYTKGKPQFTKPETYQFIERKAKDKGSILLH